MALVKTSVATAKWQVERALETVRIESEREDIGGHEAGSAAWYAYLAGRMSAQLESMAETVMQLTDDID